MTQIRGSVPLNITIPVLRVSAPEDVANGSYTLSAPPNYSASDVVARLFGDKNPTYNVLY